MVGGQPRPRRGIAAHLWITQPRSRHAVGLHEIKLSAPHGLAPANTRGICKYLIKAARAPGLQEQLERALAEGVPYLILDGKVVDTDRCREKTVSRKGTIIDLWYAGKTHDLGGNIQALFYPCGIPLWVSDVLPGNVHDLAAGRENVLAVLRPFLEAMPVLADPGYVGASHGVHVPVKKPAGVKELDIDTRARNALLRSVRCLGERGFALLTQRWRTLHHVTASPGRIG